MTKLFFGTLVFALSLGVFTQSAIAQVTEAAAETTQEETQELDEKSAAFLKKLSGTWKAESMSMGEDPAPAQLVESMAFTFSAEELVASGLSGPGGEDACDFEIDASDDDTPTMFKFKPKAESQWMTGIIKIDEEGKLNLCMIPPNAGTDLPTTFEGVVDGEKRLMVVMTRDEEESDE